MGQVPAVTNDVFKAVDDAGHDESISIVFHPGSLFCILAASLQFRDASIQLDTCTYSRGFQANKQHAQSTRPCWNE
jgi:hypothetical protein